jgi:hypothetical protein
VGAALSGVLSGSVMAWACLKINSSFRDCALMMIKYIDENTAGKCGTNFD